MREGLRLYCLTFYQCLNESHMASIEGKELFYEIVAFPDKISKVHVDCVRELVGTVVIKHFPMNNNPDFIDNFTMETFTKILPTLGTWTPDPKVHYGNYFYTTIKNTILNYLSKEFRYGLDLLSLGEAESEEPFQTEVAYDLYILNKYKTSLLGQSYVVVDMEDVDALIYFLKSKGGQCSCSNV